jgi:hypothetical protein
VSARYVAIVMRRGTEIRRSTEFSDFKVFLIALRAMQNASDVHPMDDIQCFNLDNIDGPNNTGLSRDQRESLEEHESHCGCPECCPDDYDRDDSSQDIADERDEGIGENDFNPRYGY